jgi:signal transduction histidine kinase
MSITQQLAFYYAFNQTDSTVIYASQSLKLADKLEDNYTKFKILNAVLFANNSLGDYPAADSIANQMLQVAEQLQDHREENLANAHHMIGLVNREMENYDAAKTHLRLAIFYQQQSLDPRGSNSAAYSQIATIFLKQKQLDSALRLAEKGVEMSAWDKNLPFGNGLQLAILGNVHQELGNYALAEKFYREAIANAKQSRYILARLYNNMASLFDRIDHPDSCLHYALASLKICEKSNYANYALDASTIIVNLYESRNMPDSAYKYSKVMMKIKDTLFSQQKTLKVLMLNFSENNRQQEIIAAQERLKNQIRTYSLIGALGVFLVIAFILFRNNRLQKKAKAQIETAYGELKSTQAQLIQSEKMASLGELTAGIAHEIQNPLNFVNNFSEVNEELLAELNEEIEKGNTTEAKKIVADITGNENKIRHHGKRADSIVKGMLQHSRSTSIIKEPTDINALADEYLRLAYHGFRAKDKSFNVTVNTNFDRSNGRINIIPQDIGRVLLNVYNNAFYAVNEKMNSAGVNYEPSVSVATQSIKLHSGGHGIEIKVIDNGGGIPQKIVDKIFQPFFTTKPTGSGTGLGLSLAYDIIKAHGGEIKVHSEIGEGSEFTICLPIT